MRLPIPFHSVVDIITNSSTVIYTYANAGAEAAVKDIINQVLKTAGSNKTADSLYDVSVVLDPNEYERLLDRLLDMEDYELLETDKRCAEFINIRNSETLSWSDKHNLSIKHLEDSFTEEEIRELAEAEQYYDYAPVETIIVVTQLDGTETTIGNTLQGLFGQEAYHDG